MKLKSTLFTIIFSLLAVYGHAQESAVDMADTMRSNGKIYVVLGVVLILVVGLLGYVIYLDRKLTVLEKKNNYNQ